MQHTRGFIKKVLKNSDITNSMSEINIKNSYNITNTINNIRKFFNVIRWYDRYAHMNICNLCYKERLASPYCALRI